MKKKQKTGWLAALNKYLFHNRRAMTGLAIILFFGAVALFFLRLAGALLNQMHLMGVDLLIRRIGLAVGSVGVAGPADESAARTVGEENSHKGGIELRLSRSLIPSMFHRGK